MVRPRQMVQARAILLATWFLVFLRASSAPAAPQLPPRTVCNPSERDALLALKAGLSDPGNYYLSSWRSGEDCCRWTGVECSNRTGHVIKLQINSHNTTKGAVGGEVSPSLLSLQHLEHLDLSSNNFGGRPIPEFIGGLRSLTHLDLSNSYFGGRIPPHLGNLSNLLSLDLYDYNEVRGCYSPDLVWVTRLQKLRHLAMSGVDLSAAVDWAHAVNMLPSLVDLELAFCGLRNTMPLPIPSNLTSLERLFLQSNSFNSSFGANYLLWDLPALQLLSMYSCGIHGFIPAAVGNLTSIQALELQDNNYFGTLPSTFKKLAFLRLRSNMFSGGIPVEITKMNGLQYLDIASNNISGNMPVSLGNLIAMARNPDQQDALFQIAHFKLDSLPVGIDAYGTDNFSVVTKGQQLEYTTGIAYMVNIDLSCNSLTGKIPEEIGTLVALKSLNLSQNHLSGIIPQTVGELQAVESFDLSHNELSGEIPTSLEDLTSLAHLNLSYNNLTGTIPSGDQLRALDNQASIYIGNPGLCGPPLSRNCSGAKTTPEIPEDEHEGMSDELSLYLGIGTGFVAGLWVVFCGFLFKRNWRIRCFLLSDRVFDWAYVQVMLSWASPTGKNQ